MREFRKGTADPIADLLHGKEVVVDDEPSALGLDVLQAGLLLRQGGGDDDLIALLGVDVFESDIVALRLGGQEAFEPQLHEDRFLRLFEGRELLPDEIHDERRRAVSREHHVLELRPRQGFRPQGQLLERLVVGIDEVEIVVQRTDAVAGALGQNPVLALGELDAFVGPVHLLGKPDEFPDHPGHQGDDEQRQPRGKPREVLVRKQAEIFHSPPDRDHVDGGAGDGGQDPQGNENQIPPLVPDHVRRDTDDAVDDHQADEKIADGIERPLTAPEKGDPAGDLAVRLVPHPDVEIGGDVGDDGEPDGDGQADQRDDEIRSLPFFVQGKEVNQKIRQGEKEIDAHRLLQTIELRADFHVAQPRPPVGDGRVREHEQERGQAQQRDGGVQFRSIFEGEENEQQQAAQEETRMKGRQQQLKDADVGGGDRHDFTPIKYKLCLRVCSTSGPYASKKCPSARAVPLYSGSAAGFRSAGRGGWPAS